MVLCGQDDERRDGLADGIDALDHYCLLAVARLGELCLATAVQGRNYHSYENDAHYKPSLIEVIDIVIHNTIFSLDVSYKGKLFANNL